MKELNLDDLPKEIAEKTLAVLTDLTREDEDVHIYRGEDYLFSVHRASEREFMPGLIRGTHQPGDKPSDAIRNIRQNLDQDLLKEMKKER